ncbi:Hcp family type VI secretion system effector [Pseudomonas putida CSV86]|uniref:Hcp family type VI secretion system effector n=1 Tax=Pseudomonas bharatica CSV86 TaxID=1005395 RepID=L1LTE4_9PSED|nr:Hcp family type VI secretion system effector [Pseudomonas bharatica]NNJ18751.1 Hcp family type VI secretion system effector [Pseudomonas bharatica CSV86]
MSLPAYISITGQTQGNITAEASSLESLGASSIQGHEDEILVQEIHHEITTPTDPQSGQPTGKAVHGPLTFTTIMTKGTPLLYQALADGELLPKVVLKWYRPALERKAEHFFTIELEDAYVVSMTAMLPHAQLMDNDSTREQLKVALSYRKITWIHGPGTTEGSYDWRQPKEKQD